MRTGRRHCREGEGCQRTLGLRDNEQLIRSMVDVQKSSSPWRFGIGNNTADLIIED